MRAAGFAAGMGAAALGLALLVSACNHTVSGRAVSVYADPFTVAGLPATTGPNGLRTDVAPPPVVADNTDEGFVDRLAVTAIADVEAYWGAEYPRLFGGGFTPVDRIVSWDSEADAEITFCDTDTYALANAGYCPLDNTIGWDRATLLPAMIETFGEMSVVMILAHEYGHAVQHQSGITTDEDPGIVAEQQADCFGGAFIRHVAEGQAAHFTLNTSDGLNSVLAAAVSIRDSDPNDPDSIHGSAFERVTAVQVGFIDGPAACTRIDQAEIDGRRGDLPQQFSSPDETGELPVTAATLDEFRKALDSIFGLRESPVVDYSGAYTECADAQSTGPVSYCPASNTIGVDLPALAALGTPQEVPDTDIAVTVTGDYNAYVLFGSRFSLAVQRAAGQALTEAKTALRTACLSGVITAGLATDRGPDSGDFTLSPGDVDEAVSGLLTDGLAASDVEGRTVPSGFSRVEAFRSGVLGGRAACDARYN
jgi:predicted metalloprotease